MRIQYILMLKSLSVDTGLNIHNKNKKKKLKLILEKKNEEIHIIKDTEMWCLNCRKISDHGIKDCPNKKIVCMNCNHKGHYKYDCYIYKNACYRCLSYGKIIFKEECLKHKNANTCGCIIMNKEKTKLLLVKGVSSECWGFPKGGAEGEETSIDCAKRETMEETGISVNITDDTKKEIINGIIYYYIIIDNIKVKQEDIIDKNEISEIRWFHISELIENNIYKTNKSVRLFINNLYSM